MCSVPQRLSWFDFCHSQSKCLCRNSLQDVRELMWKRLNWSLISTIFPFPLVILAYCRSAHNWNSYMGHKRTWLEVSRPPCFSCIFMAPQLPVWGVVVSDQRRNWGVGAECQHSSQRTADPLNSGDGIFWLFPRVTKHWDVSKEWVGMLLCWHLPPPASWEGLWDV